MKTSNLQSVSFNALNNTLKNAVNNAFIAVLAATVLSSCGASKSTQNEFNMYDQASNTIVTVSSAKASCTEASNADLNAQISAVSQNGQIDPNWIKIKFNYLSSQVTASGNVVRFFKWKVTNNQTYLDPAQLAITPYNLNSGSTQTTVQEIAAQAITTSNGYFINLNDAQAQFQVLKMVVYSSTGSIVAQTNILIPQFAASPARYAFNVDGSARSQLLQNLHPLKNSDASAWNDSQLNQYFQKSCF